MKKLLFNVVSVLILSICVLSCSRKDDDDDVTPITKEEIVGEWTISESPVINVKVAGEDNKQYQKKAIDTLEYLFKQGDKYTFKEDGSCKVTRGASEASHPNTYTISTSYLTFDGYISFQTNKSANLALTAGDAEIRTIVKKEMEKKGEYDANAIASALKAVSGTVKLVFVKGK
jgi:hypothetical protein